MIFSYLWSQCNSVWFGIECTQNLPIETFVAIRALHRMNMLVETPKCTILMCFSTLLDISLLVTSCFSFSLSRVCVCVYIVFRWIIDSTCTLGEIQNQEKRAGSTNKVTKSNQTDAFSSVLVHFSLLLGLSWSPHWSLTHSLAPCASLSLALHLILRDSYFSLFLPWFVLNHTPKVLERTTNFYTYSLLLGFCLSSFVFFFSLVFFVAAWFWWNKFWCFVYFIRSMFSISWYFIFLLCVSVCVCVVFVCFVVVVAVVVAAVVAVVYSFLMLSCDLVVV